MTSTPELIRALSRDLSPVRRLPPPLVRTTLWLILALAVLGLLAIGQGVRPDLGQKLLDVSYVARVGGALLTGIAAALAAFELSLPDRSKWWLLLPLPPLGLWFANIGYQCLTDWVSIGPDGMSLGETARCFATLVLASLPLALVLVLMLRYAAAFRPRPVAIMGGLAVAAFTATALSVCHILDASLMILMWNIGTAALVVGLAGLLARSFGRRSGNYASL